MSKPGNDDAVWDDEPGADAGELTETLSAARGARRRHDASSHPTFYPGELVAGRFSIVGPIGRGGMGEVYEAVDQELGQRVALKTLRSGGAGSEPLRERFRQEILLARQVTHPNVCRIFDLCFHELRGSKSRRQPLLSMELLEGETLATRLRRDGPLAPGEVRAIALQIARGLAAAHEAGVVHCDLKSSNVMLVPQAAGSRAMVMDFGLASTSSGGPRRRGSESGSSGSRTGGTPGYMAPELLRGEPPTPATDIYSLGVVIAEMLTGERARTLAEEGSSDRPGIDAFWRAIVARCLEADPGQRFASAAALVEKLDEGRGRARRFVQAAASGALLTALLALAVFFVFSRRAPETPASRPAIAVLSLESVGRDPAHDWVSSVLPELLSAKLALSEHVRLIARDTLRQMRLDAAAAPGERTGIPAATGADYVLTGSYRVVPGEGDSGLEVDLELHDARSGALTQSFDSRGRTGDLAPLIDSLTEQVLDHLRLPGSGGRLTAAPATAAARPYADGLAELEAFRMREAAAKLEEALAADPTFVLARISLIRAHLELGDLKRAAHQARLALELGEASPPTDPDPGNLSRELRLRLEALAAEAHQDWHEAHLKWSALWSFFPDEIEFGLGVARALVESSRGSEALETLRRLRAQVPHVDDPRIDLAEARAAANLGEYDRQLEAARRAVGQAERLDSPLLEARARLQASAALRFSESRAEALTEARQARRLFEQAGHRSGVADALLVEADCLEEQSRRDAAARQARDLYESVGHRRGAADAVTKLGNHRWQRRPGEARAFYRQAHEEYQAIGDRMRAARLLHNIGVTYVFEDDYPQAIELYRQSLAIFQSLEAPVGESLALNSLGYYYYFVENNVATGLGYLLRSLEIKRRGHDRLMGIPTLLNLGNIYLRTGELSEAESNYSETLDEALRMSRDSQAAAALRGLAMVRYHRGRLAEAVAALERALELREPRGDSEKLVELWLLGYVYLEQGNVADAHALARKLLAEGDELIRQRGRLLRAEILIREGRIEEAGAEVAKIDPATGNADWTDLEIRRCLLRARQLNAAGSRLQALDLHRMGTELAEQKTFKALELEAASVGCELKESGEVAHQCFVQVRQEAERMGFQLLARRIGAAAATLSSQVAGEPG